jgi:hypothetical protein
MLPGDLHGAIAGPRIDDHDIVCESCRGREARRKVAFLVLDDHAQRQLHRALSGSALPKTEISQNNREQNNRHRPLMKPPAVDFPNRPLL